MKFKILVIFSALFLWSNCRESSPSDRRFFPEEMTVAPVGPGTKFELMAPEHTGIQFVPEITDEFRYNFMADPYIYNGGGVAVLDINNDGLQDLFLARDSRGVKYT